MIRFTIFKRLTLAYAAIMLFVVFLGLYVVFQMNQLNRLIREVSDIDGRRITLVEKLSEEILSQVSFEKKFLISHDPDFIQKFWELEAHVKNNLEALAALNRTDASRRLGGKLQTTYERYLSLFRLQAEGILMDPDLESEQDSPDRDALLDVMNATMRALTELARSDRDAKILASSQIGSQVYWFTLTTAAGALLCGILISFFNTRSIHRPIRLLQQKTREIAQGRFDRMPEIASPPELRALAEDFERMCRRLQELDQMKLDFISHVSHKLRTPLTAIKEASAMLLEGTYQGHPEKQQALLKITCEECERLIDAVNKILDLSRMEANMMDYQFSSLDLLPVMQKTLLKLAPIAQRKRIDMELTPARSLPLVTIDEERISQVLENLIGNALHYTSQGGRVVLTASGDTRQRRLEVAVRDTGRGISRKNLVQIFDKFKRIDNGQETTIGTGLGLAIAKHIIADHGGRIWVESNLGEGSTFFFTLPFGPLS